MVDFVPGDVRVSVCLVRDPGHPDQDWKVHQSTRPPLQTLHALQDRLWDFGITRVANVTGLDRVGIPVFMVVRPNARSLSVSQGKGVDSAAARVSGIMEAVEMWHAENVRCPLRLASLQDLPGNAVDLVALPRRPGHAFDPSLPFLWIEAADIVHEAPVWIPYEMVHVLRTTS